MAEFSNLKINERSNRVKIHLYRRANMKIGEIASSFQFLEPNFGLVFEKKIL